MQVVLVAIGGAIGAAARYIISNWAANKMGTAFPYGTMVVNIGGCFIIGLFMTLATDRYIIQSHWRMLIAVGFLGGFTTFSSFSYETVMLMRNTGLFFGIENIFVNLIFGMAATWAGILIARQL